VPVAVIFDAPPVFVEHGGRLVFHGGNTPWKTNGVSWFPTGVNASPFFRIQRTGSGLSPGTATHSRRIKLEIEWEALAVGAGRIRPGTIQAGSNARFIQLQTLCGHAGEAPATLEAWVPATFESKRRRPGC
jgi:hypothetical protein